MDNVCNRCLFSFPSKVEMAEEQEYLLTYSIQGMYVLNLHHVYLLVCASSTLRLRCPKQDA